MYLNIQRKKERKKIECDLAMIYFIK